MSCPAQNSAVSANQGRSGFTREYGGGGNDERRVEIGQKARPLRGYQPFDTTKLFSSQHRRKA
ncbi:hypothetical protein DM483_03905 [Pseudomonas sp. SMT-1]|nr:hypothetical protein DM483_03905 [Pseudomonas sp. SMT-1]